MLEKDEVWKLAERNPNRESIMVVVQCFAIIFAGLSAMITYYSLLYPILGNPTGDKILGVGALMGIFLAFKIMKGTQFKGRDQIK